MWQVTTQFQLRFRKPRQRKATLLPWENWAFGSGNGKDSPRSGPTVKKYNYVLELPNPSNGHMVNRHGSEHQNCEYHDQQYVTRRRTYWWSHFGLFSTNLVLLTWTKMRFIASAISYSFMSNKCPPSYRRWNFLSSVKEYPNQMLWLGTYCCKLCGWTNELGWTILFEWHVNRTTYLEILWTSLILQMTENGCS